MSTTTRFRSLPQERPVGREYRIRWTKEAVPYIKASSDADAAFALGIVHAHLRWAQLEIFRHIAYGRLSEMAGPFTRDVDALLRTINFSGPADGIWHQMPDTTKIWLSSFVSGINFYLEAQTELPPEFGALALKKSRFTEKDIIVISRLAGTDINWIIWMTQLKNLKKTGEEQKAFMAIWNSIMKSGGSSDPSFTASPEAANLLKASKSGSNTVVISGRNSLNGSALIASDPHVGLTMPGFWLLVGIESPGYHTIGMQIAGLPFTALGRNSRIAWGGTNMRALSSEFLDLSCEQNLKIRQRREKIRVRGWLDRTIVIRETQYGPIISGLKLFDIPEEPLIALRWVGALPSDELTAFLKMNRAANFTEFRSALSTYTVSGQNLLYADIDGNIGEVMAFGLPLRKGGGNNDLLTPVCGARETPQVITGDRLPYAYNPATGFLASANNRPADLKPEVGYVFSSNDRIRRLTGLLSGKKVGVPDLQKLQADVYSESSLSLLKVLLLNYPSELKNSGPENLKVLSDWDGHYRSDSRAPVVFSILTYHILLDHYTHLYGEEAARGLMQLETIYESLAEDLKNGKVSKKIIERAASRTRTESEDFPVWGDMHKLRVGGILSPAPLWIGKRYLMYEMDVPGSRTTVWKTSHSLTNEKHYTSYGANARHISILKDPDENLFVLFGGQDGWLASESFSDQIEKWRKVDYLKLPLSASKATFLYDYSPSESR